MESGSWRGSDTAWWPVLLLTRATRQPSVVGESVMLRALARETREQSCALRGEAVQIRTRARAAARRRVSERTDCEAASPRSPGTGQTG